ncbi:hypothetical protein [Zunongwangia endophytica]|uniref:Thrombospondin type 3 repeat-containing protein n=1 Tax=Zunongwangia endophytica TaxID=1808945 RepID=A0ABV8H151_9FLAO|nr:hypothetical protein [Zunongwangia endophytica]MDN3594608.1 hypothetical protein [Zunongwangia endophytica]
MKKTLGLLSLIILLYSCDDGDIVVTDFAIENATLNVCGLEQKVIYATNNDGVYESLSLVLNASGTINDSVSNLLITDVREDEYTFSLSSSNRLIYRIYDGAIANDYFCSNVPPSQPKVLQEFVSGDAGTVTIRVAYSDVSNDNNDADTDGDGIPNSMEGYDPALSDAEMLDTDGDGIPDYLDIDDDGDNVPTRLELDPEEGSWEDNGFLDTDRDGTPNYLDADDDGDGVPTRNEVDERDLENLDEGQILNPLNYRNEGELNFLNEFYKELVGENPTYIENRINRKIITEVIISGFSLKDSNGNSPDINTNRDYNMGSFNSSFNKTYLRNIDSEEDSEEETPTDNVEE